MLAESHFYFNKAADVLGLSDKVRTILLTPHRTVKIGIAIEGDDGELQSYEGFRVQHNMARGPRGFVAKFQNMGQPTNLW